MLICHKTLYVSHPGSDAACVLFEQLHFHSALRYRRYCRAAIRPLVSSREQKENFRILIFFPSFVYKDTRCKEFKPWLPDSARTFYRRSVRQTDVFISECVEFYVSPGHKSATLGIKLYYEIEVLFHLNLKGDANFCTQLIFFQSFLSVFSSSSDEFFYLEVILLTSLMLLWEPFRTRKWKWK